MKRRSFLYQSSCAAVGYTTLFSTLFNLKAISSAVSVNSSVDDCAEYRALICFSMNGGNDSFNMLAPYTGTEYDQYSTIRTDLALGNGANGTPQELLEITADPNDTPFDRTMAMHHKLDGLKTLFDGGEVAFLANIGSLAEPIANTTEYYSGTKNVPLGLYSHADQQKHWQTANPMNRVGLGWGGKIADMIETQSCNNTVSVSISLDGTNTFQAGNGTFSYVISPYNGSIGIQNYGSGGTFYSLRDAAVDNVLDHSFQDAFKNAYAGEVKDANDTHLLFSGAVNNMTFSTVTFGTTRLEKSFEMIAKTIKAANTTGNALNQMKRQIFYVDMGGFDVHDEVINSHETSFTMINDALVAFNTAMKEINVNDKVTTFSISEFGRTLSSNGQGSDHGWGGNAFVMGGAVNGRKIYGSYPDLVFNSNIELGGGVYIPQISADEYFAELALWFGVTKTELPIIFPNISEFYDVMSPNNPIGLMA